MTIYRFEGKEDKREFMRTLDMESFKTIGDFLLSLKDLWDSIMSTPLEGELTLEAPWLGYNLHGSLRCGKGGNRRGRTFVCTLVFCECECILVILEVLGVFWTFVVHFSNFGGFKGILVILKF